MRFQFLPFFLLFTIPFLVEAQVAPKLTKEDKKTISRLKTDINYLASDDLEGRRTGSAGEKAAGDFLIERYKKLGISAYKDGEYRMPFAFTWGREIAETSSIRIGGENLKVPDEAWPMAWSASKQLDTEVLPDIMEQGNVWLLPLYSNEEDAQNPHFDWEKSAYERSKNASAQGASGLVFYDQFDSKYAPDFNGRSEYESLEIPVVYVAYNPWQLRTKALDNNIPVELKVTLRKSERMGTNVAAFINNNATFTIVFGAHYDHLGHGEDGNSLHPKKDGSIHNGADDNASGTAALLEMASRLSTKKNKLTNYNYLFVHFSGEELGLLGSKAFVKSTGLDSNSIAYMINLDMVGRLNDSSRALTVGGIGTSPAWAKVLPVLRKNYKLIPDSSGIGPSDHTSFYNVGVPVLFFFTGTHRDYHKPSDDADKINYEGEAQIINSLMKVVAILNPEPRPKFTATKANAIGRVSFKVTLGIMPDYSYDGPGVRVDGVSENRPASEAGLLTGDIITQLGENKINGMQSYMEALSRSKAGEQTIIHYLRDGKEITAPIKL